MSRRVEVDPEELLRLLDHVDSLVRFCSCHMPDVDRYHRGGHALWAVANRIAGKDADADAQIALLNARLDPGEWHELPNRDAEPDQPETSPPQQRLRTLVTALLALPLVAATVAASDPIALLAGAALGAGLVHRVRSSDHASGKT